MASPTWQELELPQYKGAPGWEFTPLEKFSLADYRDFLTDNDAAIAAFRQQQAVAFGAERQAWDEAGEFRRVS